MPRTPRIPNYRRHIDRGVAYAMVTLPDLVTGERQTIRIGRYDTDESRQRYMRLIMDWEKRGRRLADPATNPRQDGPTVTQLCAAYRRAVKAKLSPKERAAFDQAIKVLRSLFGETPAEQFGPNAIRMVRQAMIDGDPDAKPKPRPPWAKKTVVNQVHRIGAIFKWAAAHEILPITVYQAIKSLEPLRPGEARETEPVRPVADAYVSIALTKMLPQVKAMVELQLATGMRPGEVTIMRTCDVDTSGKLWTYTPATHKTAHHGKRRTIYLGPRSQRIIRPFLKRSTVATLFSPAEAVADRRAELSRRRKTPLSCGNRPGTNRRVDPKRKPGERYSVDSYRQAIQRACKAAGVPVWRPHQLRHNYATEVRRQYGLEAAQILLGHSSALITDAVYAERDMARAREIVAKIG